MACSTIVQACLASRRQLPAYSPPEPLEHLHVLDLLELTGSQSKAAQALAMHQSTVCRSAALMGEQFRLQPSRGTGVLRYGTNESLQLLRLSYRSHRMMDGQLRIATDPLHQSPLAGMLSVQAVPPKFRVPSQAGVSIRAANLAGADDGAAGGAAAAAVHSRSYLAGRPLPSKVLLPRRTVTPLLHEALTWHGFQLEEQPLSCHDLPAWVRRMCDRQLALPLCLGMLDPGWIEDKGLMLHPEQPPLLQQLWLLVPEGRVRGSREARHLIRTLRLRLVRAGEALLGAGELAEEDVEPADRETCRAAPGPGSQNYAPSA